MTQPTSTPTPAAFPTLTIHAARWFTPASILDVTALVRTLVTQGGLGGPDNLTPLPACLTIQACNETFLADPEPGVSKKFFLDYSAQGERHQRTFAEREWVYIYADDAEAEAAEAAADTAQTQARTDGHDHNHVSAPPVPAALTFTDIIIPTYNNAALTAACFRSIREHTAPGTYRVIWVDNGSSTDDMDLAARELTGMNRICVYLPANLGFVGAVNLGLRISAAAPAPSPDPNSSSPAPSVCLLNNDTLVTPRWLEKLNAALYSQPELGIVGPLTAYSPNGQCESQHNLNYYYNLLPPESREWSPDRLSAELEARYPGQFCPVEFVAFLCAVLKREVIEKIGLLDTKFEMGMWDDVDYNRSIMAAGYSVALAADTCIYHRGRATFAVIQKSERLNVGRLLSRNRGLLDDKWKDCPTGRWTPRTKAEAAGSAGGGTSTSASASPQANVSALVPVEAIASASPAASPVVVSAPSAPSAARRRYKTVMLALYPYQSFGMDAWADHGAGMTYTAARTAGADLDFIDLKALRDQDELRLRLRGYDIVAFGLKSSYYAMAMGIVALAKAQGSRVLVAGYHVTAAPEQLLENSDISWVFHGESEITFAKFLADPDSFPREIWGEKPPVLDALPWMDRSMFRDPLEPVAGWWPPVEGQRRERMVSVMAARGCPFLCLAGDSVVTTLDGDFAIRDLVGKDGIKVLTRHPETQKPMYASARHIRMTREMAELVRVWFTDGTHLDCTPDHRFKVFKSRNQYIEETEWDVEAQYLQPKQQVRAVRFDRNREGRAVVSTRRDIEMYHSNLVMEAVLARPLTEDERVHHWDHNPGNDAPSNLVLTTKNRHITDHHPEISERMKVDNPTKNMTPEWRENLRRSVTGKIRSLEQRLRYRESKLGAKNPRYNPNLLNRPFNPSRISEVNHRVDYVEHLPCREDVYCMEVPGVEWFYANKVLVHNCGFCQPIERNHFGVKLRRRSVDNMIAEMLMLKDRYHPDCIVIHDDTFLVQRKWIEEFIEKYPKVGLPFWAAGRADGICRDPDLVKGLIGVGWELISVGFESGSQRILDFMRKGTTVEQNLEAARIVHGFGGKLFGNYMVGLPEETREDIDATFRMVRDIKAELPSFAFFTPYPGCELGEKYIREGMSLLDRNNYNRYPGGKKILGVDYDYINQEFNKFTAERAAGGQ